MSIKLTDNYRMQSIKLTITSHPELVRGINIISIPFATQQYINRIRSFWTVYIGEVCNINRFIIMGHRYTVYS